MDAARVELIRPQPGPQAAFVNSPCDITCYGGARGGGKSWGMALDFWLHAERYGPDAKGLMLRKTREDLKDFIDLASRMYGSAARYFEKGNVFRFDNGARLFCAYLERESDAEAYQGWSLTRVYFDELTQLHSLEPILRLMATLRSPRGIPCRMKLSCNPGGPLHNSVKEMFVDLGAFQPFTDPETGISRVFIPARVSDNPALLAADPRYVDRLRAVGSPEKVRAWLEGDWNVVEGSFFPEFTYARHVVRPFTVPEGWTRLRAMDWGSAAPFCVLWMAVVQDDFEHDGRLLPRGAVVVFREWYGASAPNVGLKLTAEEVAKGIVERETHNGKRERVPKAVIDPACFAITSGPSIAETMVRNGVPFQRADNTRTQQTHTRRIGGWDQVRARLKGDEDGHPMVFIFSVCKNLIRTLPMLQHDELNVEDVDSTGDDHAADALRYGLMARPYRQRSAPGEVDNARSPWLISNAFKLNELRD